MGTIPLNKMKRGGFLKTYTPLTSSGKPMKRTRLKLVGSSDRSTTKKEIQALLREGVIKRDGGCVLRHFPEAGACSGWRNDGELILQAEHMVTRSNSAGFADLRNVVCLCRHHHGHFKPQHSEKYWELIRRHVGEMIWAFKERLRLEESSHYARKVDLKLELLALRAEVARIPEVAEKINY